MKIKAQVRINSLKTVDGLPGAWSSNDYKLLLDELGFSEEYSDAETEEMLLMALSDLEPEESASILLKYVLGDTLNEGQIHQLSHEMQEDKVCEEYADIFLHKPLFQVNQLLYKAYNGRFPQCNAVAAEIDLMLSGRNELMESEMSNQVIIKSILPAFDDHAVIHRLYGDVLETEELFSDADGIFWKTEITPKAKHEWHIVIYSSEYWFHDLAKNINFESAVVLPEPATAEAR